MIADPKKSESKAKAIAGQLLNRLPMRDSRSGSVRLVHGGAELHLVTQS